MGSLASAESAPGIMSYVPRRPPRLERLRARGLHFQLYRWPGVDARPPVVLVHGWGDSGETFQFVVDQLRTERSVLAFDCRGFGRTEWPSDGYWFPDYLADLEAILDSIAPEQRIDLVGHSMGGNIVMLYAGIRPDRVRRLVSLEGFGMQRSTPDQAPARYRQWLDELKEGKNFAHYESFEQFARVLARRNPRTAPERLDFVARSWGRQSDEGGVELRADPRHKMINPMLYQREQAEACWRAITAPLLFVSAAESGFAERYGEAVAPETLRSLFKDVTPATVEAAGHMLHHERPEAVARLLDEFLS